MVGGVLIGLGTLMLLRHKTHYWHVLGPGVALFSLGVVFPRSLKYIYLGWMTLAFVLGFVMSHLILTLFFFLVITPIGLAARVCGKDFLGLNLDQGTESYWIRREHDPKTSADYERQF
jgi:hypothetical protein